MKRLLLLSLLAVPPLMMQAETLSLDSCRSLAIANNKTVKAADMAVKGAGYERKAAFSTYLPSIDFTGGYAYNQNRIELLGADAKLPTMSFNPATMQYDYNILKGPDGVPVKDPSTGSYIPTEVAVIPKEAMSYDTRNVFAGAFTLTQPVFMGGRLRALNAITKYAEQLAVAARNNAVQDVVFAVDEAYWLVVSLKEKSRLADSFVTLVDSLRKDVGYMLDEGVATRADLLSVEVKYNEAKVAQTKVDNALTLSRMNLAQICGLPVNADIHAEDESLRSSYVGEVMPDIDMQSVYSRRQDLEIIRQGINVLESREKLALGNMLPKIELVGAYAFSNPNVNHGFEKKFGGGFSVGAAITVPLWHWGGRYNHYRATKAGTNAQKIMLEEMEEKVDLQVNQAKFSYQEAFKTYEMTLSNMKSAEENLRCAETGFKEGVLTSDDVLTAQTAWVKAESDRIDARIGIRLCEVYLSKVLGNLDY